jgi:FdhD protein
MPDPAVSVPRVIWRGDAAQNGQRVVPRETPVALTYNRSTHAVMLASPADLEDFAVGFSLSERIIETIPDILALEVVEVPDGIECRMDLATGRLDALTRRVGCAGWIAWRRRSGRRHPCRSDGSSRRR